MERVGCYHTRRDPVADVLDAFVLSAPRIGNVTRILPDGFIALHRSSSVDL